MITFPHTAFAAAAAVAAVAAAAASAAAAALLDRCYVASPQTSAVYNTIS